MKELLALIATASIVVAYAPYIRDIAKGKTKPHPYTWFVSGLITLTIFGLQYSHGGGWGALPTFVGGMMGLVIFALSLGKDKHVPITKSDTLFFLTALIAGGLWLIAGQALLSTILISVVEILAFVPTFRKSWDKPNTETVFTYFVFIFRDTLSIIALQHYSIITVLYPLTEGLVDCFFTGFLVIRRRSFALRTST